LNASKFKADSMKSDCLSHGNYAFTAFDPKRKMLVCLH